MPAHTPPEILRCEASSVFLQLKALGIENIAQFPLVDKLPKEALVKAALFLTRIGALDRHGKLTEVGRKLSLLPIHPRLGFLLLSSWEFQCSAEILSLVAMLSAESPSFFTGQGRDGAVARASRPLLHEDGDHLTLVAIYSQWSKHSKKRDFVRQYCLNETALERAASIRKQLKEIVMSSWGKQHVPSCGGAKHYDIIRRCMLKACFMQAARVEDIGGTAYQTLVTRQEAKIHPSSVLFRRMPLPPCVVFNEMVTTKKNYLRTVTAVDPEWFAELCPQHFSPGAGA
jgi:HrpA-like RNA helicase